LGYLSELTALRDQLRTRLSGASAEPGTKPLPDAAELAARITELKAKHTIDAAPQRIGNRSGSAAEPVTVRIRRRMEATHVV